MNDDDDYYGFEELRGQPVSKAQRLANIRAEAEGLLADDSVSENVKHVLRVLLEHFRPNVKLPLSKQLKEVRASMIESFRPEKNPGGYKSRDYKDRLDKASQRVASMFGVSEATAKRWLQSPHSAPGRRRRSKS